MPQLAIQRAIMLICFLYDNPGFHVKPSRHHAAVKAQVSGAIRQGVEIWQVNFGLDDTGVQVLSYHELTRQLSA
jgi:sugar fermentation stimulation protein A